MNSIFRIFLTVIFSFIFLVLIYVTFFVSGVLTTSDNFLENYKTSNSYTLSYTGADGNSLNAFYDDLNKNDFVYFTNSGSYNYSYEGSDVSIELGDGKFLFGLNDVSKKYLLTASGFTLSPVSKGMLYIDTTKDQDLVFSFGITSKLTFTDFDGKNNYSSLYLFPHNYIKFNPKDNSDLDNADLFRLKTIRKNGYVAEKIFVEGEVIDKKLNNLLGKDGRLFFEKFSSDLLKNAQDSEDNYKKLKSLKTQSFPGKEYVEEYMQFFINDEKLISYYKNLILNDLVDLVNKDDVKSTVIDLSNNLQNLKEINEEEYLKSLDLIDYYYSITLKSGSLDSIFPIINFVKFYEKINGVKPQNEDVLRSYLYLSNIYALYDVDKNYINLNKDFIAFTNGIYLGFSLNGKDNSLFLDNRTMLESMLFFLESYIDANLFKSKLEYIESEIEIFSMYVSLSKKIYFSSNGESQVETGLSKNLTLLKKLSNFFKSNIFESEREDRTELLLTQNGVDPKKILLLEEDVDTIIDLYLDNNQYLDLKKDKLVIILYKKYKKSFEEFFLALKNRDQYKKEYSKVYKNLSSYDTEDDFEEKVTSNDVKLYLSQFKVDMGRVDVSSRNYGEYFTVSGMKVLGGDSDDNYLSFDIYPSDFYRIEKIILNKKEITGTYYLEDERETWNALSRINTSGDEISYVFNEYFYLKFIAKKTSESVSEIEDEVEVEEDKSIVVFKRDALLGDRGEFASIKDNLKIEYKDITVESLDDILVSNADLKLVAGERDKKFVGDFTAKYIINNEDNYFYGTPYIKLNVFSDKLGKKGNQLYGGATINITGKIYKDDFTDFTKNTYELVKIINSVYSSIVDNYYPENGVTITYDLVSKKLVFKFENKQKTISISLVGEYVSSIRIDGVEKLEGKEKYNTLSNILRKIN